MNGASERDVAASRRTGERPGRCGRSGTSPRRRGPTRAESIVERISPPSTPITRCVDANAPAIAASRAASSVAPRRRVLDADGDADQRSVTADTSRRVITRPSIAWRTRTTRPPDELARRRTVELKRQLGRGSPISRSTVRSMPSSHGSTSVPPQSSRRERCTVQIFDAPALDLDESQLRGDPVGRSRDEDLRLEPPGLAAAGLGPCLRREHAERPAKPVLRRRRAIRIERRSPPSARHRRPRGRCRVSSIVLLVVRCPRRTPRSRGARRRRR